MQFPQTFPPYRTSARTRLGSTKLCNKSVEVLSVCWFYSVYKRTISNICNEISAWWLVCYLEQDLKPRAFFTSFFLACRTCVSGFQLVWSVPFEMFHPKNLCIGSFDRYFISTKRIWLVSPATRSVWGAGLARLESCLDSSNYPPTSEHLLILLGDSTTDGTAVWRYFEPLRGAPGDNNVQ